MTASNKQVSTCPESVLSPQYKMPKKISIMRKCVSHPMNCRWELVIPPHTNVCTAFSTASVTAHMVKYRALCTCNPWRRSEDFGSSRGKPCFLLSSGQVASKWHPRFDYFALELLGGTLCKGTMGEVVAPKGKLESTGAQGSQLCMLVQPPAQKQIWWQMLVLWQTLHWQFSTPLYCPDLAMV